MRRQDESRMPLTIQNEGANI